MWGKTNTNKSITNGTATPLKVLSGYTFYAGSNTIQTGTYVPPSPLGSIYIASNNLNLIFSGSGGSTGMYNFYSVNVGNTIYSFAVCYASGWRMFALYFTTDSSAFPVKSYTTPPYTISPSYQWLTQYLDSGIIYFNGYYSGSGVYYYDTFNTSTKAWTTGNSGSHTTGTLINSPLQLNGFQYDSNGLYNSSSGSVYTDIQTKVTKL
jgi:hypothetical protein